MQCFIDFFSDFNLIEVILNFLRENHQGIASIASILTAVYTYRTVREMKFQTDYQKKALLSSHIPWPHFIDLKVLADPFNEEQKVAIKDNIIFEMENIGNGNAINVSYRVEDVLLKNYNWRPDKIEDSREYIRGLEELGSKNIKYKISSEKVVQVSLNKPLKNLLELYLEEAYKNNDGARQFSRRGIDIKVLSIQLSYQDIFKNSYTKDLTLTLKHLDKNYIQLSFTE